jgi:hypothetical protein
VMYLLCDRNASTLSACLVLVRGLLGSSGSNLFYTATAESSLEAKPPPTSSVAKRESKRISVGTEGRLKPERAWGDEPVVMKRRLWVISGMVLSILARQGPLVSNLGN